MSWKRKMSVAGPAQVASRSRTNQESRLIQKKRKNLRAKVYTHPFPDANIIISGPQRLRLNSRHGALATTLQQTEKEEKNRRCWVRLVQLQFCLFCQYRCIALASFTALIYTRTNGNSVHRPCFDICIPERRNSIDQVCI